eukprot:1012876-Rhodomonas_salina.1
MDAENELRLDAAQRMPTRQTYTPNPQPLTLIAVSYTLYPHLSVSMLHSLWRHVRPIPQSPNPNRCLRYPTP